MEKVPLYSNTGKVGLRTSEPSPEMKLGAPPPFDKFSKKSRCFPKSKCHTQCWVPQV